MIFLCLPFSLKAEDLFYGVMWDNVSSKHELYSINLLTGVTDLKQQFAFPSGNWTPTTSFMDSYNGKYYLKDSNNVFMIYDTVTDTISQSASFDSDFQAIYPTTWSGKNVIKVTSDGATHIGENSLVTIESGGRQQLYATNSSGNRIDINIPSGTNLLVDGVDVMDSIDSSVALGAAFASLPTNAEGAGYTCGLGTGYHDGASAIAGGCGFDFQNFAFVNNMPEIFHNASFNVGTATVFSGESEDATLKAGITFKFGSAKPIRTADKQNLMLENKINAMMH